MSTEEMEDAEARNLMKEWGVDKEYDGPEDPAIDVNPNSSDYDDYLEQFRREVYADDNALDHVLLGTSDMDAALSTFEKLTGHRPIYVVSLNGLGTKSARIAFEEGCCFLEIVAPDPKQSSTSTELKSYLSTLEAGALVPLHYAVRRNNAKEFCEALDKLVTVDAITMVSHYKGEPWNWDMVILDDSSSSQDGYMPLMVDWGKGHHAAGRLPIVADKATVTVSAPSSHKMHKVLRTVDVNDENEVPKVTNLTILVGEPSFTLSFTSKNGKTHSFTSTGTDFRGIRFPAEGGLPVKSGKF
jgi:Glyoxalase-like domain